MRIAVLQSFLPSRSQGGVGHFTDQLVNQLVEWGHPVTVYSLDPAPVSAAYEVVQPGPDVRLVRGRLGDARLRVVSAAARSKARRGQGRCSLVYYEQGPE
jgi:hypothetical protein